MKIEDVEPLLELKVFST